ncbi:MAG: hypothetical protein A3F10_02965 [Coxiella sp. RIFCSPHIGHO2_12_FULL_42_15]|nr:MAG: hypothetical protein A3F10_02965 [Coxiella sp. RIFCSPHIGHO2_12_FULL_42_15]
MLLQEADLIAIDWGSSNFRAFLLNRKGVVLQKKDSHAGLLNLTESYPVTFQQQIGDWLSAYPSVPVLMCGMVGSAHGWQEIPYLTCPLSIFALAQGIRAIHYPERDIRIVPGLCLQTPDRYDVMRGEETKVIGSYRPEISSQLFCLPGTHSKWVHIKDHQLINFTTYFTGELFSLLVNHSILAKQITPQQTSDWDAFDQGMRDANRSRALLSDIFTVRPRVLFQALATSSIKDYLSGLLIAHEIMEAQPYWELHQKITLLANTTLSERYARAFQQFNLTVQELDVDAAITDGLLSLAIESNLLKR